LLGEDGVPFFDPIKEKAYLATGQFWVNNHAHVLTAIENIADTHFLLRYLNRFDYTGTVTGSTRLKLTQGAMREIPIPLPPLPEQTRIANKLDTLLARVDSARERLDRVPGMLKRFRQAVLTAATSGVLTEAWRGDGVSNWIETDVQAIAAVGTGSTPLRSNPAFFSSNGTPWVTSAATSQALVQSADEFVTAAAINAHRLKVFPIGTLLVAMYGEGKTRGQVSQLGILATINQACAAIVVDQSRALSGFIKLVLQANYFEMRAMAEGGNQPNLNLSKIKEFPIQLPTLPEQTEIVRQVEILFAYADRLEAHLKTARKLSESLSPAILAKAFRGELVAQDPNDEPAVELLRRIRAGRK
jgi:type I restriction enzyme, S subunit